MARLLEGHGATHSAPRDPLGAPPALGCQGFRGFPAEVRDTHSCWDRHYPPCGPPCPPTPALLGKEGFKGRQQAAGPQAVGELDASVHSCRRQAEELVHRVAELLHAVDELPVLLVSKCGQREAASGWGALEPRGGPRRHPQECGPHVGQCPWTWATGAVSGAGEMRELHPRTAGGRDHTPAPTPVAAAPVSVTDKAWLPRLRPEPKSPRQTFQKGTVETVLPAGRGHRRGGADLLGGFCRPCRPTPPDTVTAALDAASRRPAHMQNEAARRWP